MNPDLIAAKRFVAQLEAMKTIAIIENDPITFDGTFITFKARGRIDDDGTGSAHGDPDHQDQTSLKHNGRFLNADTDRYIVVPPQVIQGVEPVVLGSQAWVTYRGKEVTAVVGDIGPHKRLGEMSISLAEALGINANANTGGDDTDEILYRIQPGMPAVVDGIAYQLQHS